MHFQAFLSPLLKASRLELLNILLWWELGTNLPGPCPVELLSFWHVTSKQFWFWYKLCWAFTTTNNGRSTKSYKHANYHTAKYLRLLSHTSFIGLFCSVGTIYINNCCFIYMGENGEKARPWPKTSLCFGENHWNNLETALETDILQGAHQTSERFRDEKHSATIEHERMESRYGRNPDTRSF